MLFHYKEARKGEKEGRKGEMNGRKMGESKERREGGMKENGREE